MSPLPILLLLLASIRCSQSIQCFDGHTLDTEREFSFCAIQNDLRNKTMSFFGMNGSVEDRELFKLANEQETDYACTFHFYKNGAVIECECYFTQCNSPVQFDNSESVSWGKHESADPRFYSCISSFLHDQTSSTSASVFQAAGEQLPEMCDVVFH